MAKLCDTARLDAQRHRGVQRTGSCSPAEGVCVRKTGRAARACPGGRATANRQGAVSTANEGTPSSNTPEA